MPDRILQIIPADGWYARFQNEDNDRVWYEMLICWAIVKSEGGKRYVDGIIGAQGDRLATISKWFDYFVHRNDTEEWELEQKPWEGH